MRPSLVLLIAALFALFGCAGAGADPGGSAADSETLNGTVVLRQPAQLPPGSLLTVTLEDVSLADAPAATIAQTQIQVKDQAPIPFVLVYPSAAVKPGAVYAVRARLSLRDQLLFTTTERYQVDALNPVAMQLLMDPVAATPPPPDASLTDTYWKLLTVAGQPVVVADQMREPQLVLNGQDGRFAGSGGVNRLMGGYTVAGGALTFSQVASTMMAGPPEAMQQEQAIVTALGNVRGFSVAGDQLTLTDQFGQPLITAVAVALR